MNTINIIGISIVAVFLLFIFMKKDKQLTDYFLIAINLILAGFFLSDLWLQTGFTRVNYFFHNVVGFYLFPAFLTYGMLLINGKNKVQKSWWWFYIYAVGFTTFMLLDLIFLTDYDAALLEERYYSPTLSYHFFFKTHKLFVIVSLIWFLSKLKKYQSKIKDFYSFIEPLQLNWVKNFAYIFIIINTVSLFGFLSYNFGWIQDIGNVYTLVNSLLVLSIFYLSYHGIKQYTLAHFQPIELEEEKIKTSSSIEKTTTESLEKEKYKTSSLTAEEMDNIFKNLKTFFEEKELYKEPQLKIQTVAENLKISSHHLSQTINSKTEKPFYDFVNEYRVNKLKEKLISPTHQHYTILALGLECGFNSKASLNRIFKLHTEQSPSQYQKSHLLK